MLSDFINSHFHRVNGASVPFDVFVREFFGYLEFRAVDQSQWPTPSEVRAELRRLGLPVGHSGCRHALIGNLASPRSSKIWKATGGGQIRKVSVQ